MNTDRRLLPALAAAAVLLAVVGGAVYAALSSSAFNTNPQHLDSGSIALVYGTASFRTPVSNMAPGDTVAQFVEVSNPGTLDANNPTLAITDATPSLLSTSATRGLQVQVQYCSRAWTNSGATCPGTHLVQLNYTPVANVRPQAPVALSGFLAAGTTAYLKIHTRLPDATETTSNGQLPTDTVQGLGADLTWTLSARQRAATVVRVP